MPERLIYTNYPHGNSEWKFMLLITNHNHYRVEFCLGFNLVSINDPNLSNALNLQSFQQSFVDSHTGVSFVRTIVADYSTTQFFISSNVSYCEVGVLTPFVSVDPVSGAVIISPMVSDVGLNLNAGPYNLPVYQNYFAEVLAPYNAWYNQQVAMHVNWLQQQATPQLQVIETSVETAPTVSESKEAVTEPVVLKHVIPIVRVRSSSFSHISSGSSTPVTSDGNESDDAYMSEDLDFDRGLKKNPSRHSFTRITSASSSIDLLVAAEEEQAKQESAPLQVLDAKDESFIPVVGGRSASLILFTAPSSKKSLGNAFACLDVGLESEPEPEDEVEVEVEDQLVIKPIDATKSKKAGNKPVTKPKKAKRADKKKAVPVPAVVNNTTENRTQSLIFSNVTPVVVPAAKEEALHALAELEAMSTLELIARVLYKLMQNLGATDARLKSAARVFFVYSLAHMQGMDLIVDGSDPSKYLRDMALLLGECIVAAMAIEVIGNRIPVQNVPRPRLG